MGALQYGGQGAPEAIVVSDLPLQGDSKQRSLQMNDAIRLVLEGANWQAGGVKVGFQACDDSSAEDRPLDQGAVPGQRQGLRRRRRACSA